MHSGVAMHRCGGAHHERENTAAQHKAQWPNPAFRKHAFCSPPAGRSKLRHSRTSLRSVQKRGENKSSTKEKEEVGGAAALPPTTLQAATISLSSMPASASASPPAVMAAASSLPPACRGG